MEMALFMLSQAERGKLFPKRICTLPHLAWFLKGSVICIIIRMDPNSTLLGNLIRYFGWEF